MIRLLARLSVWNWIPYAILILAAAWFAYDNFVPVLSMQGRVLAKDGDAVTIGMAGKKLRDCQYLGIQAYSQTGHGIRRDTHITRIDRNETRVTRPRGIYDIGQWRIRPVDGATSVTVWAQHSCREGDVRLTKIAEVAL